MRNAMWTMFTDSPDPCDINLEYHNLRYIIYNYEICPTSNKPHRQGYIELKTPLTIKSIQDNVFKGIRVHIEERRGTQEEAIAYCKKTESQQHGTTPFEWGTRAEQGARTDLKPYDEACMHIMEGIKTPEEIAIDQPALYGRHYRAFNQIHGVYQKMNTYKMRDVTVVVQCGDPGTGKTHNAIQEEETAGNKVYTVRSLKKNEVPWFCGYNGEATILIEDFRGDIPLPFFLNILEGRQLQLPMKGSHTYAAWTKVIINSNMDPATWYPAETSDKRLLNALLRRLTTIKIYEASDELKALYEEKVKTSVTKVKVTPQDISKRIRTSNDTQPDSTTTSQEI
jgi:hypothetical protein